MLLSHIMVFRCYHPYVKIYVFNSQSQRFTKPKSRSYKYQVKHLLFFILKCVIHFSNFFFQMNSAQMKRYVMKIKLLAKFQYIKKSSEYYDCLIDFLLLKKGVCGLNLYHIFIDPLACRAVFLQKVLYVFLCWQKVFRSL